MWHLRQFLWMVTLRPLNASEVICSWVCVWHTHTLSMLADFGCHSAQMCGYLFREQATTPRDVLFFSSRCAFGLTAEEGAIMGGEKAFHYFRYKYEFHLFCGNKGICFWAQLAWVCHRFRRARRVSEWESPMCSIQRVIWEKQLEPGWLSSLGFLWLWRGKATAALTNGNT